MSIVTEFAKTVRHLTNHNIFSISELKFVCRKYSLVVPSVIWGCRNADKKIDLVIAENLDKNGYFNYYKPRKDIAKKLLLNEKSLFVRLEKISARG